MVDTSKLYTNPRSPKKKEQQEAKKGDIKTGRDFDEDNDDQWESIGTETLTDDKKIVSPDGLDRSGPPLSVKKSSEAEELRVKDSNKGRTREWYRRKPAVPVS